MLVVLSPAKKLNFEQENSLKLESTPTFLHKSKSLSIELKKLSSQKIGKLMKLSKNLSDLNFERFQNLKLSEDSVDAKQAIFAFNGDTYTGFDVDSLETKHFDTAQNRLRILSGLYGVLRPFDKIEPYRLEMGTKLAFDRYKNLYEFWKNDLTDYLNNELSDQKILVNCASQEYFGAVDEKKIKGKIITPVFKENRNGELKIISFSAKKARGMFARFIIENNIKDIKDLKTFNHDKYVFNAKLSNDSQLVFIR